MRQLFLVKSLDNGLVLGEVLETVSIGNKQEFVVQNKTGRFFIRKTDKVALIAASNKAAA